MNKKNIVIGIILLFIGLSLFTLASSKNFKFCKSLKESQDKATKNGPFKIVNDPPTDEALKKFTEKWTAIVKTCPQPSDGHFAGFQAFSAKCACAHIPEFIAAEQIRIKAYADLLKRHPELENQTVVIKGDFERISLYLSQDQLKDTLEKNTLEGFKRTHNCK